MSLKSHLRRHGLTLREFDRFCRVVKAKAFRLVERYDGVQPAIVEAGRHSYTAHDVRMLAARC